MKFYFKWRDRFMDSMSFIIKIYELITFKKTSINTSISVSFSVLVDFKILFDRVDTITL